MITTYLEAIDAMFGMVKATLDSESGAILGYVPDVRWQGVEESSPPELNKTWAHVYQMTVNTRQAGFNDAVDRLYATVGVLTIELFVARSEGRAMQRGRQLSEALRQALEGTRTGGVWYRNVTATEELQTDSYSVFRIMADYEYTEQGR